MTVTLRGARSDPAVVEGWGYTADPIHHYFRARRALCRRFTWSHGPLWPDLGATEPGDCPDCTRELVGRPATRSRRRNPDAGVQEPSE